MGTIITPTGGNYRIEELPNGLYRVEHRPSQFVGLYNADGSYRCGDLQMLPSHYKEMIRTYSVCGMIE